MSGELSLSYLGLARIGIVGLFALLYSLGGRDEFPKAVRRYAGGIIFPIGVMTISWLMGSFSYWFLLALIAYPVALSKGYGGDYPYEKFIRRGIYGLGLGSCCFIFALPLGLATMGIFQLSLAVMASIYFGIKNPIDAANEETIIATLSVILVPFMV